MRSPATIRGWRWRLPLYGVILAAVLAWRLGWLSFENGDQVATLPPQAPMETRPLGFAAPRTITLADLTVTMDLEAEAAPRAAARIAELLVLTDRSLACLWRYFGPGAQAMGTERSITALELWLSPARFKRRVEELPAQPLPDWDFLYGEGARVICRLPDRFPMIERRLRRVVTWIRLQAAFPDPPPWFTAGLSLLAQDIDDGAGALRPSTLSGLPQARALLEAPASLSLPSLWRMSFSELFAGESAANPPAGPAMPSARETLAAAALRYLIERRPDALAVFFSHAANAGADPVAWYPFDPEGAADDLRAWLADGQAFSSAHSFASR